MRYKVYHEPRKSVLFLKVIADNSPTLLVW